MRKTQLEMYLEQITEVNSQHYYQCNICTDYVQNEPLWEIPEFVSEKVRHICKRCMPDKGQVIELLKSKGLFKGFDHGKRW